MLFPLQWISVLYAWRSSSKYRKTVECVISNELRFVFFTLPVINLFKTSFLFTWKALFKLTISEITRYDLKSFLCRRWKLHEKQFSPLAKFASISFSTLFWTKSMPIIASQNMGYLNIDLVIDQLVNFAFVFFFLWNIFHVAEHERETVWFFFIKIKVKSERTVKCLFKINFNISINSNSNRSI